METIEDGFKISRYENYDRIFIDENCNNSDFEIELTKEELFIKVSISTGWEGGSSSISIPTELLYRLCKEMLEK